MSEIIGDDDGMVRTARMDTVQGLSRMIISLIDLACKKEEEKKRRRKVGTSLGWVTQGLRVSPRGTKEVSHLCMATTLTRPPTGPAF